MTAPTIGQVIDGLPRRRPRWGATLRMCSARAAQWSYPVGAPVEHELDERYRPPGQ